MWPFGPNNCPPQSLHSNQLTSLLITGKYASCGNNYTKMRLSTFAQTCRQWRKQPTDSQHQSTKLFFLKLEVGHPVLRLSWLKYSSLLTTLLCCFLISRQRLTCKAAAAQAAFIVALGRSHNLLLNQTILLCVGVLISRETEKGAEMVAWMFAITPDLILEMHRAYYAQMGRKKKNICGHNRLTEKFTYPSLASAPTGEL